ncbi:MULTISPECIES: glutathione S-transferase N-terminal domain-containing protein [Shewanella]|uniref:glutathione S-transferase N-terminal domain-containing protein n=1 Tax=Shewanella TaxID=22 RepID=UPI00057A9D0B|nr:glutathione S-transferase N-terminal domain-containing protein [Shewanella sp. ECSMB14102]
MQLYYSTASPYARVVRVIARELGLALDEKLVNPFDNSDELLSVNPLGKIPCLLLDDGAALFDSEVIARFLDDKFGQNCFFGPPGNWAYECQFSLLKGALDSAVGLRQEQMREEEGVRSSFWSGRFEQALLRALMEVERQGIIASGPLDARQVLLLVLLEYLDFRHPDLDWRKVAPALAYWLESASIRQSFRDTRPG